MYMNSWLLQRVRHQAGAAAAAAAAAAALRSLPIPRALSETK